MKGSYSSLSLSVVNSPWLCEIFLLNAVENSPFLSSRSVSVIFLSLWRHRHRIPGFSFCYCCCFPSIFRREVRIAGRLVVLLFVKGCTTLSRIASPAQLLYGSLKKSENDSRLQQPKQRTLAGATTLAHNTSMGLLLFFSSFSYLLWTRFDANEWPVVLHLLGARGRRREIRSVFSLSLRASRYPTVNVQIGWAEWKRVDSSREIVAYLKYLHLSRRKCPAATRNPWNKSLRELPSFLLLFLFRKVSTAHCSLIRRCHTCNTSSKGRSVGGQIEEEQYIGKKRVYCTITELAV